MLGRLLAFLLGLLLSATLTAALDLSSEWIAAIEKQHGIQAGERARAWQSMMESAQDLSEDDKLRVVNDFFNQLRFLDDVALWGVSDYWTTPFEFLVKNGGDCEDFAIAKYFTLIHVGVPEERLRLTYVKALDYDQAHMVLTYFATPRATPLVLDNLNPHILPATERADLQPVYSFNGTGLWLAKSAGSGKRVGGAERLDLWRDLQSRMPSMAPDAPGR
ncbi:sulfate adenylyltransferase [Allochromatium palmeri]|uniref:Sulfate adenylyltransferase n=1 Tax=Allochromatium palmeri TaxID=231048 RepID=A0A6N8EEY6_9GAMM|nr:sulfate adenylyltransferase [Allochromatium palmeri]